MAKVRYEVVAAVPRMSFPIFSWIVRIFQGTDYSHYAIIKSGEWVLDSTISGVVWNELHAFRYHYKLVKKWTFEIDNQKNIYEWSAKYSAKKYSLMQNIGAGLKWIGLVKHNPFGEDEALLNCSELVAIWCRDFLGSEIEDTDQYDLLLTEKLLDEEMKRVSNLG